MSLGSFGNKRALLYVQCFPPLLKQAGGVAKDYLALCRALIDDLDWQVTIMTQVDVSCSSEDEVDRWLRTGRLRHIPVPGVRVWSTHGVGTMLDALAPSTMFTLVRELICGNFDLCFLDDVTFRTVPLLLAHGLGVSTVATTHTDMTGHGSFNDLLSVRFTWRLHVLSAFCPSVHATVSTVFAEEFRNRYWAPVQAIWPPVLWSTEFLRPVEDFALKGDKMRSRWCAFLRYTPRAIFLFAGRWSAEKRIKLLFDAIPKDCALVIVGDGDTDYADEIESCQRPNVLALRRMLGAEELRSAYAACDFLVSASRFETLGNTVVEAWAASIPVVVQPARGHLEMIIDGVNSFFVDFDCSHARERLEGIVSAKIDGTGGVVQAAVAEAGGRLRSQDFASKVQHSLLEPALRKPTEWKRRGIFVNYSIRAVSLFVSAVLWLFLCLCTRLLFSLSCNPRFEFLVAGTALETERWNSDKRR